MTQTNHAISSLTYALSGNVFDNTKAVTEPMADLLSLSLPQEIIKVMREIDTRSSLRYDY